MNVIDLTGQEFGRLFVVELVPTGSKRAEWLCLCECGGSKVVGSRSLRRGDTRSCGCLYKPWNGLSALPEYSVWMGMISRCTDPANLHYKNYGGRGIRVDPAWADFNQFLRDVGRRPFPGAQLDRERNHEGYGPSNCRWVTRTVNARNRRSNVLVTLPHGEEVTLAEAAERSGVNYGTLRSRYVRGRPLFAPVRGAARA